MSVAIGRLCPLYSRCKRKLAIYEIKVIQRSRVAAEVKDETIPGRAQNRPDENEDGVSAPALMAPIAADMFIVQVRMFPNHRNH